MSALELREVSLILAGRVLVGPLSRVVEAGTILTISGPSGVGKSSLLAFLCGVLPAAFTGHGRVLHGGLDITTATPQARQMGILFQDDLLFPHLSVGGNLAFGLRAPDASRSQRARLVEDALESVDLKGFAGRDPATLSGGQRARVSLLRVLLSQPRALLLDEPFSHLDPEARKGARDLTFAEVRRRRLPAILVTHDQADAEAALGPSLFLEPRIRVGGD